MDKMEPFELSLRQVNFEEKDIKEEDNLDSFGNIVCYDSDFKENNQSFPVLAKKLIGYGKKSRKEKAEEDAKLSLIDLIHESKQDYYTYGPGRPDNYSYDYKLPSEDEGQRETARSRQSSESSSREAAGLQSPSGDSFKAFTGTVDALALQNSVIGNSSLSPASADEVARVIAETQRRLGEMTQDTHHMNIPPRPNFLVEETNENLKVLMSPKGSYDITMTTEDSDSARMKEAKSADDDGDNDEHSHRKSNGEVVQRNVDMDASFGSDHSISETVIIHDVEEHSEGWIASQEKMRKSEANASESLFNGKSPSQLHLRNASSDSSSSPLADDLDSKSLIRVPKENITVEKSSTWFYSRGNACSNPKLVKEDVVPEIERISVIEEKMEEKREDGETIVDVVDKVEEVQQVKNKSESSLNEAKNSSSKIESESIQTETITSSSRVESSVETVEYEEHINKTVVTTVEVHGKKEGESHIHVHQGLEETRPNIPEVSTFNEFCKPDGKESQSQPGLRVECDEIVTEIRRNDDNQSKEELTDEVEVMGLARAEVKGNTHLPSTEVIERQSGTSPRGSTEFERNDRGNSQINIMDKGEVSTSGSSEYRSERMTLNEQHHPKKNVLEVDITESPKNYEKKVEEMELENLNDGVLEEEKIMAAAKIARSKDLKKLRKELQKLLKVKAKLEGQLEVMEIESKLALQQRADLQSHVAGLKERMKGHEASVRAAIGERDAVTSDLLTLKQNKARLEQVIIDAHKLLADKDEDLKTLSEDLQMAQQANEGLQAKLKDMKRDVQAKESTVQDLKNKIAELYVQFQTTNQTRILLENEIKSLKSEIKSVTTAKEWYQEQLQQAQDAKNLLQNEITNIKGDVIGKATLIERLKADNVRVKQHLADTQQRVIQEKQLLAQHLEAIEADMLEREATFSQVTRERDTMQEVLRSQGIDHREQSGQQQSSAVTTESTTTSNNDMSDLDLRRLNNDVKRKQAHIAVLEHEQSELMKRLALSQESILERDKAVENLEKNFIDAEILVKKLQQDLSVREEELGKTIQEKNLIESELSSVKSEKKSFDNVVQNLKEDMTKVERSFRHIKQELAQKNQELSQYKSAKDLKNEEIAQVFQHREERSNESNETTMTEEVKVDRKYNSEAMEELETIKFQKAQLEKDLSLVKQESASQIQQLKSEKIIFENKIAALEARERQSPERKAEVKMLVQETLKEVERSREILQREISSRYVEINNETLIRQYIKVGAEEESHVIEENNRLKLALIELLSNKKGLMDNQVEGLKSELDEVQRARGELEVQLKEKTSREHEHLASRVAELERELHIFRDNESRSEQEIAMNMALELEKEKGKMLAILQSYEQLKKHTSELEAQMAQKESNTVALSSQAQLDLRGREKLIVDLQENVHMLQQKLDKERSIIKEVKKQLLSEKGGHVKTRRKFESLWVDHDQMRVDYETKIKDLESTMALLEKSKESEQKYREAYEKLNRDFQNLKVERETLRREFGEKQAKDPLVDEQIKSLEWQLKEKDQEIFAAKQQLTLVQDRQTLEADNLKKTMQANTLELSKLREQLAGAKREKTAVQTRSTELKSALQTVVQTNKHGKNMTADWDALEKLLQESASPAKQSKPLSFLQATLSDLRGEISTLQTQMDVHTTALQSSSQSWRELEQQVQDLREVCKSTAAEREASKDLLSSSAVVAAQSPVAMATQAVARNTAMEAGTDLIPPMPVKIPTELDFSLPPNLLDGSTAQNVDKVSGNPMGPLTGQDPGKPGEHALIHSEQVPSEEHSESEKQRWINTKALIPNSVYSPPTTK